ncbi:unnamed protein product [Leptosia nina]|uniref:Uncharacterized protein n=1 Tax=Leptosia nina TaxID=320188 RepID=A0AAV1JS44_9NEOP
MGADAYRNVMWECVDPTFLNIPKIWKKSSYGNFSNVPSRAYRAKIVEAVVEGYVPGLFVTQRPLETDQEGVCENFARGGRGQQHRCGDTLQPHDHRGHQRLTEAGCL